MLECVFCERPFFSIDTFYHLHKESSRVAPGRLQFDIASLGSFLGPLLEVFLLL